MCRVLRMTRSGFYAWLHKPLSERAIEDLRLLELTRASYAASHGIYGSPRVILDFREAGETCGKHRSSSTHAATVRARTFRTCSCWTRS
jgi:putative transposase